MRWKVSNNGKDREVNTRFTSSVRGKWEISRAKGIVREWSGEYACNKTATATHYQRATYRTLSEKDTSMWCMRDVRESCTILEMEDKFPEQSKIAREPDETAMGIKAK